MTYPNSQKPNIEAGPPLAAKQVGALFEAGDSGFCISHTRRLWSLWDMINSGYGGITHFIGLVASMRAEVDARAATTGYEVLDDKKKHFMDERLMVTKIRCTAWNLTSSLDRLNRIAGLLARPGPLDPKEFSTQLQLLIEALQDDLNKQYFYWYPQQLATVLKNYEKEWAVAISAFPSAKEEIKLAVDCYCMGHPTAAIFHLMRVSERGLRALARERRVKIGTGSKQKLIEWATWQDILNQLEVARGQIGKTWKSGHRKDAALSFYGSALAGLHSFKDEYRNLVMHVRRLYEMEDAAKAMRQVRDFMNGISAKVGDATRGSIRKWT